MTRSSRSFCMWLVVAAVLLLVGQPLFAQATLITSNPGDSRAPVTVNSPGTRIPTNSGTKAGYDFDTTLTSTDYYTFQPNVLAPPNPDVAVGPDDILVVLGNKMIARFPNPNAATPNPTVSGQQAAPAPTGCGWVTPNTSGLPSSTSCATASYGQPTSQVFLDTWLGDNLSDLCPTLPRGPNSCIVSNATVRYDQMQGRFLVLFSVLDTGATNGLPILTGSTVPTTRKANWVLLVSKFAGLYLEANPTTTQVFTTPNPPNDTGTPSVGGPNGHNWIIYTSLTGAPSEAFVASGNINAPAPTGYTAPNGFTAPDCSAAAFGTAAPCYIPTDVRLGLDNDNVIVTATVFNDNVAFGLRGSTVQSITITNAGTGYTGLTPTVTISAPPAGGTQATATATVTGDVITAITVTAPGSGYLTVPTVTISAPGEGGTQATATANIAPNTSVYSGTRLRVYKKNSIYKQPGATSAFQALTAGNGVGNGVAAPPANTVQGDYYDLFPFATPWTLSPIDVAFGSPAAGSGVIYEPTQLRGRALATFSGNANLGAVTYLIGSRANAGMAGAFPGSDLEVQPIAYTNVVFNGGTYGSGQTAGNAPTITGGVPYLPVGWFATNSQAPWEVATTAYTAPVGVPQAPRKDKGASPLLYVGDARPERAVLREGLLYDARVGLDNVNNNNTFNPGAFSASTTIYDILNTVGSNAIAGLPAGTFRAPFTSYKTEWGNGNFFSPMYEVPADVIQYGSMSPINLLPYFEKLFVATTYPALPPAVAPDTRGTNATIFSATTGAYSGVNNCRAQEPGVNSNMLSWPGLFDFRCGEDAYDTLIQTLNPFTGIGQAMYPFPTRGGAGNDPNDLSMWMFGAYARGRQAGVTGFGQWGTHLSNYSLTFQNPDPYGNQIAYYTDVPVTNGFFPYIQIARQTEIAPGGRNATSFNPDLPVNRAEMAYWVVRAQMDEQAITNYLNATGGTTCSFNDVGCPNSTAAPSAANIASLPSAAANSPLWWRYIETMYRRGYTKGCGGTTDPTRAYCPGSNLKRQEMSVFLVRAKMNSVFPTVVSGSNNGTGNPPGGDLFGMQYAGAPYFNDVPTTNPYFLYIQKMRELRITNGTGASTFDPEGTLTRAQIATFLVRAFFI
jgi:hypothetical protein